MTHEHPHGKTPGLITEAVYFATEADTAAWAEEGIDQLVHALDMSPRGIREQDITILFKQTALYTSGMCAGTIRYAGTPFNVALFDQPDGNRAARLLTPVTDLMALSGIEVSYESPEHTRSVAMTETEYSEWLSTHGPDNNPADRSWPTVALTKFISAVIADGAWFKAEDVGIIATQDLAYAPGVCAGTIHVSEHLYNLGVWDTPSGMRIVRMLVPVPA
jgi:hypothetical protein